MKRRAARRREVPRARPTNAQAESRTGDVIRLGGAVLILGAALAPAGTNLVWGLGNWSFAPGPVRLVAAAVALILLVAPGPRGRRTGIATGIAVGIAIALAVVWVLFPARTVLFGDGVSIVHAFGGLMERTPRSPIFSAAAGFLLEDRRLTPGGFVTAVGWISFACGVVYLGVLAWLWTPRDGWSWAALGVLVGGYLGLFQRYLEAYAPVVPVLAAYLGFLVRAPGPGRSAALLVLQIALVATHTVGVVLAPVTLWVLAGDRLRRPRWLLGSGMLVLALGLVLTLARDNLTGLLRLLDPTNAGAFALNQMREAFIPRPWTGSLGVVHPMQLLEVLNGYLLSLAPAVLLLTALLWTRPGRNALRHTVASPFGVAVGLLVAARLLTATGLGPLLDWDLYSVFGLPVVFLALAALERCPTGFRTAVGHRLLVVGVFLLIPWMLVLHRPEAAVRKLGAYLASTPAVRPYVASGVHHHLGDEHVRGSRPAEAAREFRRAYDSYPRSVYARAEAQSWLDAGEGDRALAAFRRAISLDPGDRVSREMVGMMLAAEGDSTQAREAFQAILAESPEDPSALFGLAMADRAAGRGNEALAGLARAVPGFRRELAENPRRVATRRKLILCLISLENYQDAGTEAQVLIDQGVGSAADWYHLGLSRLKLGDSETALTALERAHELDPADATILALRDGLRGLARPAGGP